VRTAVPPFRAALAAHGQAPETPNDSVQHLTAPTVPDLFVIGAPGRVHS
jgi:hypothetical protein